MTRARQWAMIAAFQGAILGFLVGNVAPRLVDHAVVFFAMALALALIGNAIYQAGEQR